MRIKKHHIPEKEFHGIRAEGTSELFVVDYVDDKGVIQKRRIMIVGHVDHIDEEIRKVDNPTPEEIAFREKLFADTYREKRVAEYPHVGDQLDAIMKWLATETEISVPPELKSLAMKCMSVKAKYPKE